MSARANYRLTQSPISEQTLYGLLTYELTFLPEHDDSGQDFEWTFRNGESEQMEVSNLRSLGGGSEKFELYLDTMCVLSGEKSTLSTHDPCPDRLPARLACWLQNRNNYIQNPDVWKFDTYQSNNGDVDEKHNKNLSKMILISGVSVPKMVLIQLS